MPALIDPLEWITDDEDDEEGEEGEEDEKVVRMLRATDPDPANLPPLPV